MPGAPLDDDQLDGCEVDFAEEADEPGSMTERLRSLFPDGKPDEKLASVYRELAKLDA